ncbi:heme-binding beta-barrel domain-containing protein, partial [Acidithiobacillus sp.]|uniref:heme-binding beta-barrel domain-containing protein n=1 Tax=Acidithiobacillus sp. TaxID=1872118 RepID=UPI002587C803
PVLVIVTERPTLAVLRSRRILRDDIERSRLSDREVGQLLSNLEIKSFATRDEQEIADYAELMDLVFSSWQGIPFTENHIKQLHQILRPRPQGVSAAFSIEFALVRSSPQRFDFVQSCSSGGFFVFFCEVSTRRYPMLRPNKSAIFAVALMIPGALLCTQAIAATAGTDTVIDGMDYGPLATLVGTWKSSATGGVDVAPGGAGSNVGKGGVAVEPFYETITFTPAGDATNASDQHLAAIFYHQQVFRKRDNKQFHDQIGYLIYDKANRIV